MVGLATGVEVVVEVVIVVGLGIAVEVAVEAVVVGLAIAVEVVVGAWEVTTKPNAATAATITTTIAAMTAFATPARGPTIIFMRLFGIQNYIFKTYGACANIIAPRLAVLLAHQVPLVFWRLGCLRASQTRGKEDSKRACDKQADEIVGLVSQAGFSTTATGALKGKKS